MSGFDTPFFGKVSGDVTACKKPKTAGLFLQEL